ALIDFNVAMALVAEAKPFVMIVHCDRQDFLGPLLADHVLVEFFLNGPRRGDVGEDGFGAAAATLLLIDDRLAQFDALAADIDVAGAFNRGSDVAIAFAEKGAIGVAIASGVS